MEYNSEDFGEVLFREGTLVLKGIGKFEVRTMKPRTFMHNLRKEIITTRAYKKIHFTPYANLKKLCKK